MRAAPRLLILAGLIQAASAASAEFFGIPLPELVGSAPVYGGPPIEVPFDFGQEFEKVERVMLVMEATVTPLVHQYCGVTWGPAVPCEPSVVNLGFLVDLDGPGLNRTTTVVDDFRGYPTKQAGVFDRSFIRFSFDHLTDGSGTLRVWWNGIAFTTGNTEAAIERVGPTSAEGMGAPVLIPGFQPPTGTIIDALLIVEATPLTPESGSALLGLHVGQTGVAFEVEGQGFPCTRKDQFHVERFGEDPVRLILIRDHPYIGTCRHNRVFRQKFRFSYVELDLELGDRIEIVNPVVINNVQRPREEPRHAE